MIPGWLGRAATAAHSRADWQERATVAIRELGPPIYAVAGEWLPRVSLGGLSGSPCQSVLLRHRAGTRQIEVTTGRRPLGGTRNLLHRLMVATVHDPAVKLPFELRMDGDPVTGTPEMGGDVRRA